MPPADRSDSLAATAPQGREDDTFLPWSFAGGRGRLQMNTLIALRWRGILGQALVLAICALGLGLAIPWRFCAPLMALSVALNLGLMGMGRKQRRPPDWENVAVLAFDTVQLAALVFVTGGVDNPFAVLLVAPIALAAGLAAKKATPFTVGTLRTDSITFGFVLLGTVILVGALLFLPAAVLGPVAEHLGPIPFGS